MHFRHRIKKEEAPVQEQIMFFQPVWLWMMTHCSALHGIDMLSCMVVYGVIGVIFMQRHMSGRLSLVGVW